MSSRRGSSRARRLRKAVKRRQLTDVPALRTGLEQPGRHVLDQGGWRNGSDGMVVSLMENSILNEVVDTSILTTGPSTPLSISSDSTDRLSGSRPREWAQTQRLRGCAGFRTPELRNNPRARAAGVRKAPRHEIAGVGHRQCSGGYGDFAAASVLGRLGRDRQFGRFGLKLRRAWRFERADRTLRDMDFGEIAGQSCEPARAGVLPGESRP